MSASTRRWSWPWGPGAALFAICFGLGSGLTSILGGTLPLEPFGREGYRRRLGWCTSAKQLTSAIGMVGAAAFLAIVIVTAAQRGAAESAAG